MHIRTATTIFWGAMTPVLLVLGLASAPQPDPSTVTLRPPAPPRALTPRGRR